MHCLHFCRRYATSNIAPYFSYYLQIIYFQNYHIGGFQLEFVSTVKLGNKERFDKEQIGIMEPFTVTNLPFTW